MSQLKNDVKTREREKKNLNKKSNLQKLPLNPLAFKRPFQNGLLNAKGISKYL